MTIAILIVYVLCQLALVTARRDGLLLLAIALGVLAEGALVALSFDSVLIAVVYAVFAVAITISLASKSVQTQPAGPEASTGQRRGLIGEDAFLIAWIVLAGAIVYQLASNQPIIGVLSSDIAVYAAIASIIVSVLLSRSNLGMIGAIVLGIGATGLLGSSIASERDLLATITVILAAGIFVGHYLGELAGYQRSDAVGD